MQQCMVGQVPLTCGLRSSSGSSCKCKGVSGNPLLPCRVNSKLHTGVPFSGSSSSRSNSRGSSQARHHLDAACRTNRLTVHGLGKDTVEGWIDLSKLVSGSGGIKTAYEDLAYKIGKIV